MNTFITVKLATKFNESFVDVQVDSDNDSLLKQYNWRINYGGYVSAKVNLKGKIKEFLLHRLVVENINPTGLQVDHVDGNKLNNRRDNLRVASNTQNSFNIPKTALRVTSSYKGVSWDKLLKTWIASITYKKKTVRLYRSSVPEDCAYAYNYAALFLVKQFAYLNTVTLPSTTTSLIEDKVLSQLKRHLKYTL